MNRMRSTGITQKTPGMTPGALIFVGKQKTDQATITIIDYGPSQKEFCEEATWEDVLKYRETPEVTWINLNGLHDVELVAKLGKLFDIHPLALEDILNANIRPKIEDYGEYILISMKMLYRDESSQKLVVEQISFILGENFVLSFQEKPGDVFQPIRERMNNAEGRIRNRGTDYLCYALIDAIVDHYFLILEPISEEIESLEQRLFGDPTKELLMEIRSIKREMLKLKKAIWPSREVVSEFKRMDSELISEETGHYVQDVYDHTIQVIDTIETLKEMASGMMDIYLSSVSNKMNEVMQVLTLIATIMMPLTLIAGVYGMNFEFMPELHWKWSYPVVLAIMLGMGVGMVGLFKRKNWL